MAREITIPQQSYTEDFMAIEEFPGNFVRVAVGVRNIDGDGFDVQTHPPKQYTISGDDFSELNGPATPWAPDKPEGTYRNQDLWYFVDKARSADA